MLMTDVSIGWSPEPARSQDEVVAVAGAGTAAHVPGALLVELDHPVVVEECADVRRCHVVRRIESASSGRLGVDVRVVHDQQHAARCDGGGQRPLGFMVAVVRSAGYCAETRSNSRPRKSASSSPAGIHSMSTSASRACSAARAKATDDTSSPVTSHPIAASQTASAPSPQPTSSARAGARPTSSVTRVPLGRPLQIRSDPAYRSSHSTCSSWSWPGSIPVTPTASPDSLLACKQACRFGKRSRGVAPGARGSRLTPPNFSALTRLTTAMGRIDRQLHGLTR